MKLQQLGVWLHGMRVASIVSPAPGRVRCTYTDEALGAFTGNDPVLSCSLPLTRRPQDGSVFFAGLLPEGRALHAMAELAGVAARDTFGLLARFGRDVAGAVVISAEAPVTRPGEVHPYREGDLADVIHALPDQPLDLHDDSELSLAGLQNKLLLVELEAGGWGRPVHGRPSTHILKAEDSRYPGLVELEAACLRLARAAGLTTVDAWTETHGDIACIVVSRFDRSLDDDGTTIRIHQEDTCQALERDPQAHRGRGKYHDAGGPEFSDIAGLLDHYATDVGGQLAKLLKIATFTAVIGNADAHGKNIAVVHREPATIELAPLYDTVPTVLWPKLRRWPAMPFGARVSQIDGIRGADLLDETRTWPMDPAVAADTIETFANQICSAADDPAIRGDLGDLVTTNLERILATL